MDLARGLTRILILPSLFVATTALAADRVRDAWASTAQATSYLSGKRCDFVREAEALKALDPECATDSHHDAAKSIAYREAAIARGDLKVHTTPEKLPPGEYTYAVLDDGSVVTGRVHDNFEVGVKHTHLANGRSVVVAGELKVDERMHVAYNTESGTYTRTLIEQKNANEAELKEKAGRALGLLTGSEPESTTRLFWADRSPSLRDIARYCADHVFSMMNGRLCPAGH